MSISKFGNKLRGRGPENLPLSPGSTGYLEDGLSSLNIRRESTRLTASAISDIGPSSLSRLADRREEPKGLHVVYTPPGPHKIDIVFVHGLGGTSRLSWSYDRNLANFWPKEWLPQEPGFKDARILTFGYHAHFHSPTKDVLDISAFSKMLLFDLKCFCTGEGDALGIGKVPIIFVVHSMGGLVVKEACILGRDDTQYKDIIKNICSIVFLATPHRGSNLAEMLNNILSITLQSPKQYVNDLKHNSVAISGINEQFRTMAENLDLVSFFETLPTSVFLKKMIIVERDSAVLGYSHEMSAPLHADHHGVSKFESRHDSNYIRVRNAVKTLIDKFITTGRLRRRSISDTDSMTSLSRTDDLRIKLDIKPMPLDKLTSAMDQYVPESCDWILTDPGFVQFMNNNSKHPTVLHMTGGPGTGKTILSSYLIKHLESLNFMTQFWYFQYDDNTYRSNRQCLLSLCFQVMDCVPAYKLKLSSRKAGDLETIAQSDLRSLWQKLFLDILDTLDTKFEPLYWVIDAVDESESANAFFQLLGSLNTTRFPLRIILLTRSQTVTKQYEELRKRITPMRVSQLALSTPQDKIELYIKHKMADFHWGDSAGLQNQIREDLLRKSRGSYLWLYLVMGALADCYGEEDLKDALEMIPPELTDVYQRLEEAIVTGRTKKEMVYATAIFSWVTCADRPLNKDELSDALQEHKLIHLSHTINRLCGDFITVSKSGIVTMVHHTARDYILKSATSFLRVDAADAHTAILDKCLSVITDPRLKWQLKSKGNNDSIRRYCCLSWANHLVRSNALDGPKRNHYIKSLKGIFSGQAVLVWIEAVATAKQLSAITATSRALLIFTKLLLDRTANEIPGSRPLEEIEFLASWATELVRIVGKFGSHLIQCPASIHKIVPLFCPPCSLINEQYLNTPLAAAEWRLGKSSSSSKQNSPFTNPKVTGISNINWDDSLAKLTFGSNQQPSHVFGLDSSFGVLCMDSIRLYDASTIQEIRRFQHDGRIIAADFNSQGSLLVTASTKSVRVWSTADGSLLKIFQNPRLPNSKKRRASPQAVSISGDASEVIVFGYDSVIRRRKITEEEIVEDDYYDYSDNYITGGAGSHSQIDASSDLDEGWTTVELYEHQASARAARGSAHCVSFSRGGSQVAVSYRVWPTSVWNTKTGELVGRCEPPGHLNRAVNRHYDYPNFLGWNPATEHVVGISTGGIVFKWDPVERYAEEMESHEDLMATELAVSPDGRLLVTSQRDGSLKVFSFDSFTLLFNLTSMKQPVSMAFSPDGRRIYDIRGQFCNVWQPNALIRIADQDERSSDSASSHYDHSVTGPGVAAVNTESLQPVTAIAAPGNTGSIAYAFGNEDGYLKFYSDSYMESLMMTPAPSTSKPPSPPPPPPPSPPDINCGSMGITCISFSRDGTMMATATRDNQVAVRKLAFDRSCLDTRNVVKIDAEGSVVQVVLDLSGRVLLVHTRDATRVWNLFTKQVVYCVSHDGESCQWLASPTTERSFVAVQPSTVSTLAIDLADHLRGGQAGVSLTSFNINYQQLDTIHWYSVAPKLSRKLHQDFESPGRGIGEPLNVETSSLNNEMAVHRVFPTPRCSKLLIQMSAPGFGQDQRETRFILLDVSCLARGEDAGKGKQAAGEDYLSAGAAAADDTATLYAQALPQPVLDLIEIPLGFMLGQDGGSSGAVLAFIDRDFWVRTWRLEDVDGLDTKRHFFVPTDWVNMDCLDLAMVTLDGRFLCPRNGEVAVIHNGLSGLLNPDM